MILRSLSKLLFYCDLVGLNGLIDVNGRNYFGYMIHSELILQKPLPNGLSLEWTNEMSAEVVANLYKIAFSKDIPIYYRDSRATPPKEFIRANSAGSEDLVELDLSTANYTFIKHLVPIGKGRCAFLPAGS